MAAFRHVLSLAGMGNTKTLLAARENASPSQAFPDRDSPLSMPIVLDCSQQQPGGHRMPKSWISYFKRLAKDVRTPLPGPNQEVECFNEQLKRQGPDGVALGHLFQQAPSDIKKYLEKQIVINNEGNKHPACREDTATHWAVAKGLEGEVGSIASAAGYAHLLNANQRHAVIPKKSLGTYLNTLVIRVSGIPDGAPASQIRGHLTGLWRKFKKEAYEDGSPERKVAEAMLAANNKAATKERVHAIIQCADDLLHTMATGKIVDGQRDFVEDYA
jgi:hypothetical protein